MTTAQMVPLSFETPAGAKPAIPGQPQPISDQVARIALRIKDWRRSAGLSLQALANRSDVSPSTIHKIENGQTVPTIAVLLKLAEGLGRRPTDLLDEEDGESGAVLSRADAGPRLVTRRGLHIEWLMGDAVSPEIELWRITHPAGYSFGDDKIKHLSGDVVLHVESGALEVTVANDEFEMAAGDTLHFRGSHPHSWRNVSDRETVCLLSGNVQPGSRIGLVERMRRLRNASTMISEAGCASASPSSRPR